MLRQVLAGGLHQLLASAWASSACTNTPPVASATQRTTSAPTPMPIALT
jgi:hypothetical protein